MTRIDKSAIIHSTAVIEEGAVVGKNVKIGPFCCVGMNVELDADVELYSHVVLTGNTKIGKGSRVFPFASLGQAPQDLKYKGETSRLEIGQNTTIREYVTANVGTEGGGLLTKIGDNCLIMAYCHIAHDCIVGDNVIMVNGVNLAGHVVVDDFAIIGGMSAVKQFIRIGKHAMIGGFTGVDRDVIPYGIARSDRDTTLKGLNIIGMKRRGMSIDEIKVMLEAYQYIFDVESEQFTKNVKNAETKFIDNSRVREMIEFIQGASKNPVCTTSTTDKEQ